MPSHWVKSMFVRSARHWQGTRQTGTINRLYNHDLRAWAQTPAAAPSDQGGPEFSGIYLEQPAAYGRGAKLNFFVVYPQTEVRFVTAVTAVTAGGSVNFLPAE